MEDNRIPVTIITGFLGAGKTTLLNNLIKKHKEKKFAIIENEFGEIGIDGGLIVGANENIFELSNGCICCSLNDDFYEAIQKLTDSPYEFNHLLVETTGIADPTSIIKAFISSDYIQRRYMIDCVVCLADAINMEDLMDEQPEVRKQLSLADIVLLNKIDGINLDYVHELTKLISDINPMAKIYPVSHAGVSDLEIIDTFAYSGKEIEKSTLSFRNLSVSKIKSITQPSVLFNGKEKTHKHDITSEGFVIPGDFDAGTFSMWMQNFLHFNSDTMFRVKGIISFHEKPDRYIFHAVRGTYMFEIGEPWGAENRFSKLVFIGKNINRDMLEDNLYQLLAKNTVENKA